MSSIRTKMTSGFGPDNLEELPTMKRSHCIRAQRERYSADLPYPVSLPTVRPTDSIPQPPPPKKRVCLAPSGSAERRPPQSFNNNNNPSRRIPRVSNYTKPSNQFSQQVLNGSQRPPTDFVQPRQQVIGDILSQLTGSFAHQTGPVPPRPQIRPGIRTYEPAPPRLDHKEAPNPNTEGCRIGKHFKSPIRGPRAEAPISLGRYIHEIVPSALKRTDWNRPNYQALREQNKWEKTISWCSECKGTVGNCPVCGLIDKLGYPREKPPSEKEMIRQNADLYIKLFGFDDLKPKPQPKPPKKRKEPPVSRQSLYPDGERPEWDTPAEKGPEYNIWHTDETPDQTVLWKQFEVPEKPAPDVPQASKPILAALRPRDKISEPFTRQRPENNTGKICFKCWEYGHFSRECPEDFPSDVEEQEIRRVLKSFPLPPAWEAVLRNHNIEPMTVEKARENQRPGSLKSLQNSKTLEQGNYVTKNPPQALRSPVKPPHNDRANCGDPPTLRITTPSYNKAVPDNTPSNSSQESAKSSSTGPENASEFSVSGDASSDIPSNSFFKPDNARYKPVGIGVEELPVNRPSPIANIPNEIISNIIRFVLEDDTTSRMKSTSGVYEEESCLKNRNLQLDSIRKINSLWRSMCQAELYRSVPMTSLRTLKQFADCVGKFPQLSALVREVKISIPFMTIDGWTPSDIPRTVHEDKNIIDASAKHMSLIIAACPNLSRLDASFAGALQALSYVTKAHSAITHLSIDEWLPKKSKVKHIGRAIKNFPNLQLLRLEARYQRPIEWKSLTIGAGDFVGRGHLLTSIGFKDFPVHDEFLEKTLPNFPLLKVLQIERCPGVSRKGLAKTIMKFETPRLRTLLFVGLKPETSQCNSGSGDPHLCEVIATKLGSCLVDLNLSYIPVCEKLGSSITNWSQLEKLVIESIEFQGCGADSTEAGVQEAMAVSGISNLRIDSYVFFGIR
ncbi:hypothetical protein TWF730_010758 [Orbilia blumenaviensis]|uniref:CCHC-type domain-containing protein n=1 Tax=Orbilia blumenaviensis TaxID=1796055 RepID=A0AAV9UP40_9PEZI